MEVVHTAIMRTVPGARDAGLTNTLFWGSLTVALLIAFAFNVPVDRAMIVTEWATPSSTGAPADPSPPNAAARAVGRSATTCVRSKIGHVMVGAMAPGDIARA
jgi:hypothetical protein